jgi:hypothetical protein
MCSFIIVANSMVDIRPFGADQQGKVAILESKTKFFHVQGAQSGYDPSSIYHRVADVAFVERALSDPKCLMALFYCLVDTYQEWDGNFLEIPDVLAEDSIKLASSDGDVITVENLFESMFEASENSQDRIAAMDVLTQLTIEARVNHPELHKSLDRLRCSDLRRSLDQRFKWLEGRWNEKVPRKGSNQRSGGWINIRQKRAAGNAFKDDHEEKKAS